MPREKKILGPVIKTTALIPENLYRELFPTRDSRVAATINEALELLAESRRTERPGVVSGRTKYVSGIDSSSRLDNIHGLEDDEAWMGRLRRILGSGHGVAVEAVKRNIEACLELVDRARETPEPRSDSTSAEFSGEQVTNLLRNLGFNQRTIADAEARLGRLKASAPPRPVDSKRVVRARAKRGDR